MRQANAHPKMRLNHPDALRHKRLSQPGSFRMACYVDERIEAILNPKTDVVAEYAAQIEQSFSGLGAGQCVTAKRVAFMKSLNTKPSDTAPATPPHQSMTNHSQPGNLR
jgi:hypothetical protein